MPLCYHIGLRFKSRSANMRKILSYILHSSSTAEAAGFQAMFEKSLQEWLSTEVAKLPLNSAAVEAFVQRNPRDRSDRPAHRSDTRAHSAGERCASTVAAREEHWARRVVGAVLCLFDRVKSIANVEMTHARRCKLSAEKVFSLHLLTAVQEAGAGTTHYSSGSNKRGRRTDRLGENDDLKPYSREIIGAGASGQDRVLNLARAFAIALGSLIGKKGSELGTCGADVATGPVSGPDLDGRVSMCDRMTALLKVSG